MDRGAWQATVHGIAKKSDTTKHTHTHLQHLYLYIDRYTVPAQFVKNISFSTDWLALEFLLKIKGTY